ncbi:SPASM domain-containing protein [Methylophilaceae bacterium]|nr:SPASM domain-containing protein [Methylophilaceae bacterium]|tara:strand:- start:15734 stop:16864 length:1131 start_codon:yes stop_codon:yes gene_type:complete
MGKSKVVIPIRNIDQSLRLLQDNLLTDGSINFDNVSLDSLLEQLPIDKPITKLSHPEVRYEVTDHCNASCIMCPRDEHEHGRAHGIMDQGKYEKSIDEIVRLGAKNIVLTGFGEPMLDKKLELKIAYAKKKGLFTYIISNGSVLNSKRAKKILEAGLDEIRISFYGMGSDTYNTVMQGLDFETTKNGLLKFIKLRDEQNFKTKIQISYLTLPENEKDEKYFREFWEPLVDAIEIWRPHNFGDGRDYRDRVETKTTCGRPETGPLQIQWDGEVIPCCYDYNNKIVLGNAFEQPVLEILNEKKYRLLRYAHKAGLFNLFPYCDQCDQLLPHSDALVYSNRHNLPAEEAVKLSNTDLYNLAEGSEINKENLNNKYKSKV